MPARVDPLISTCGIVVDRTVPNACTIRCRYLSFVSLVDRAPCVCRPCALWRTTVADRIPAFHDALPSDSRATKLEIARVRHGLLLGRKAEGIAFPFTRIVHNHFNFPRHARLLCFFDQMDRPRDAILFWRSLGGKVLVDAALRDSGVYS